MKPDLVVVERKFKDLLDVLGLDMEDDNLKDTPKRLAKMYVEELFSGVYNSEPEIKRFPKSEGVSLIYTKVPFNSTCAHHFQPIKGVVHVFVDYSDSDFVIGLSKFNRIIEHICKKPTLQEDITQTIAKRLSDLTGTTDVCVFTKATHSCVTDRGVCAAFSDTLTFSTTTIDKEFINKCYTLLDVE